MFRIILSIIVIGLASVSSALTADKAEPPIIEHINTMLKPSEAKSDIDQWINFIEKTHPDLAYTTKNIKQFYRNVNQFKNSINKPISVKAFWLEMMLFNSQISDGHVSLTPPKLTGLTNSYLQTGGTLFPFDVVFDDDRLMIKGKLNGEPSNLTGYAITSINDKPIEAVLKPLLKRTHGDSDNQRQAVLAPKFATYYWLLFGEQKKFKLSVKKNGKNIQDVSVSSSRNQSLNAQTFESSFQFSILDKKTALLTINTFTWREDEDRVFRFFKSAFEKIKDNKISHLLIDIRENGGGDDNIWIKGIYSYIADKPWKTGSSYAVKILEGSADEGETVGEVVKGELDTFRKVDVDNPLKFTGDVSVLVGPYTYSSSILFMNVMQDYGFGRLVGNTTGGKTGQTGGTQHLPLTHSRLHTVSPRFWLTRPSGDRNHELVTLDTVIDFDPIQPNQLIEKLLEQHK